MKSIQVFDPALCCSTGVCGVDVDQSLVAFAADAEWSKRQGAPIERFNLAQQPLAFTENATVKNLLESAGQESLPVTLVDGQLVLMGRYPTRADLARWLGLDLASVAEQKSAPCCSPAPGAQPDAPAGCGCANANANANAKTKSKCCG